MRNLYPHILEISTEPAAEPVTSAEFKTYINLHSSVTGDDSLITSILKAARFACELYCNRAFIDQSWKLTFDNAQPDIIYLPKGKINSVTTIKTYYDDGTTTTESSSNYIVKTGENGSIWLKSGSIWATTTRTHNIFEVIYKVGFGAAGTNVPDEIKLAILATGLTYYDTRDRDDMDIPPIAKKLLSPWRIFLA
jgi:uncharacterized phiE125 gp8 family phage protein